MPKKLYRSKKDRMISGVCGGLAEYLNIDPTLVRIGFIALAFLTFFTLLIGYFLCVILIPEADGDNDSSSTNETSKEYTEEKTNVEKGASDQRNRQVLGICLIGIGAFVFLRRFIWWFDGSMFWSIAIIGVGLAFVFMSSNKKNL
jgi:phage shock protein C